ncbi:deoxyribonuclease V [Saccharomonospora glauca]|uniref:Endonuclease V n=1 Tax=Saccharomonospora glauca K62 TaxID=928724 RepID=I1D6K2_9PSEU|nr:deoxyribonuclease V [Saccharomonospora glauca]EIF00577.1 deoxyinosine 3'endonuclease (endonuclease V) [Saccharomonospora glauca K62]
MEIRLREPWPTTVADAVETQLRLRGEVRAVDETPRPVRTVAGVDVAYDRNSPRLAAAVVVLDHTTLEVLETSTVVTTTEFPYEPGLFAFWELPAVVEALRRLRTTPDLLVCDGHGLAHPRRFGLACHLGVLTGVPTFGVAKTVFVGEFVPPASKRGSWSPLVADGEVVGAAVRTRDGVKPVFVSIGHRIDLDTARDHTITLCTKYRLPETTRHADHLSREVLAGRISPSVEG